MSRAAGLPIPPGDRPPQTPNTVNFLLPLLVIMGLAPELFWQGSTRDDVLVELFKLIGIFISALASCFALWIANQNRKVNRRVERKVDVKRKAVRRQDARGDDPTVTIVEDRRKDR